ncbi:tribbles homolog 3 [Acomys russatus]|uniref:tribbles homolog 3 n=1 Tax=Acomys russatus TaxID=60746 RepID=UPI0021E28D85|nr:tribbles homolog 3 [Acomys russatus]
MEAIPLAASTGVSRRKKPLEFDTECPVLKRVRVGPEPGPRSSLLPPSPPPASDLSPAVAPATRLGPYVVFEGEQGNRTFRALHCPTGTEYTCKVYPASDAQSVLAPYARLPTHQHVARPVDVLLGSRLLYAFFAQTHGDLHSLVRSRRGVPEAEAVALFRQMAAAVAHCHQHGLVLRDLKLRRFVFSNCERTKLLLENLEDACVMTGPDDSLWDKHACPAYVGPEILSSRPCYSGKAADVWSLGVALFTMLAGRYPFQDSEPALLFSKILRGTFALPEGLSVPARCLVRCLLRKEPSERPVAPSILLHPWLREDRSRVSPSQSDHWERDQVVPDGPGLEEAEEGEVGLYG